MPNANIEPWEVVVKEEILPDLERGRPNWDKPHTLAVVKKLKSILEHTPNLDIDRIVLIIAAYAHDWGYVGRFGSGIAQIEDIQKVKAVHMEIGAQRLEELLKEPEFDFLSKGQKARAVHLVRVHDKLEELRDVDELVLMEADTLGAADSMLVKPSFDAKSNKKWVAKVRQERASRFITDYSKSELPGLLAKREIYYQSLG